MSISARVESHYLTISNKEKCTNLLKITKMTEENKIDFYISLHIVLETNLNTLFRHLTLMTFKKNVDPHVITENLDKINFIDKVILFIYNSKFDFKTNSDEVVEHHKIIGKLRNFCQIRNKLLHGHSISNVYQDGTIKPSLARKILDDGLSLQIEKFKEIIAGMRFFVNHLDNGVKGTWKESFSQSFLDDDFINVNEAISQIN